MTVEHRPWALKSCKYPSDLSSTVKYWIEKGGGSVTKQTHSERNQEAVIFRALPPAPHPPPSIFLLKIDYLPVLGLRAGVLHMFDAYTRVISSELSSAQMTQVPPHRNWLSGWPPDTVIWHRPNKKPGPYRAEVCSSLLTVYQLMLNFISEVLMKCHLQ